MSLEFDMSSLTKKLSELEKKVQIGQIVKVPFGKGNKTSEGFILNLKNDDNIKFKTKNIAAILVKDPVIDEDDINLIEFLREKGLAAAAKKAGRVADEGIVKTFV